MVVAGLSMRLVDLPGTYSLHPFDAAEQVTRDFLLSGQVDAIINVVDASVMSRSLELTVELIETGLPIVVALNMMDDAQRKGITIDIKALEAKLGVPVVSTIATRGQGVSSVALKALHASKSKRAGIPATYDRDTEESLNRLMASIPPEAADKLGVPTRFLAIRLLQNDEVIGKVFQELSPDAVELANKERKFLADEHNWPEESVFASHRHAVAMDLFEEVARVVPRQKLSWRD